VPLNLALRSTPRSVALALALLASAGMPYAAAEPAETAPPAAAAVLPPPPFTGNAELKARLDAAGPLAVGGERLHGSLLRRFYEAHGYHTVWDKHPDVASALWKTVLAAGDQGIDPALFHAGVLGDRSPILSSLDRELLESDAFLSYADALARGAYPVEDRYDDEDLQPPNPSDPVAALDRAIAAPDPGAVLTALAPSAPEYETLRRAYLAARAEALGPPRPAAAVRGRAGRRATPIPRAAQQRMRLLAVNLERLRWLPRPLPADRILVNTASELLQLFRSDRPIFSTRVIVGQTDWQTPEFISRSADVLFNPPWNVPPSIMRKEILPKLAADPGYLAQHHMRWRNRYSVQQEAGPYSALGRLKFEMDDRFDVYLHDTPERNLFYRADRHLSHGCVRVENPAALAALLLGTDVAAINRGIARGTTHRQMLAQPLPVLVVYQTAYARPDGSIVYTADPYQRDEEVWQALNRPHRLPIAQRELLGQRKG
jgi:murein L,D-transpeptidase YcbB/YkuD